MQIKITEDALELERNGEPQSIEWSDIRAISFPLVGKHPKVRTNSHGNFTIALDSEKLAQLMPEIFSKWIEKNPHLAKKMAFDYAEPPKQGAWLMIILATLFCFILCWMLWLESYTQFTCTNALHANPKFEQNIDIVKLKKKKRGNFQVELKFTASNGQLMEGKRLTLETYDPGNDPNQFAVVYAESKPHCWVLSESPA